jgi:hypothetical protein
VCKDIITALSVALTLQGCPPAAPPASAPAAPPASPVTTEPAEPAEPAVDGHLAELKNKQRCNRLMGCEPALALLQLGPAVVPSLVTALEEQPLDGRYWQVRLIALLGQLGDARALDLLHEALKQPRWELRTRAAMALAAIADRRSIEPLRALLDEGHDLPTDGAALHGLQALGAQVDGRPPHRVLTGRLPATQSELGLLNPGHFAFLAELVGAAKLRDALQLPRWGAIHRDRFTRMASLQTLMQLKDAAGVPYIITRLDDPSPGVRRQALRALRIITGRHAFTRPEHWRDWCEQRKCMEAIRGLVASPSAGRAVQPGGEDTGSRHVRRDEEQLNHGDHRQQGRPAAEGQD